MYTHSDDFSTVVSIIVTDILAESCSFNLLLRPSESMCSTWLAGVHLSGQHVEALASQLFTSLDI